MQPSSKECLLKRVEELEKISKDFGFYWETIDQLIEQIQSECIEVQEAWKNQDRVHLKEEVGDLIQAAVSLAIFCKLDPHETLLKSIEKYHHRFNSLVKLAKEDGRQNLKDQPFDLLKEYWDRAKSQVKKETL